MKGAYFIGSSREQPIIVQRNFERFDLNKKRTCLIRLEISCSCHMLNLFKLWYAFNLTIFSITFEIGVKYRQ